MHDPNFLVPKLTLHVYVDEEHVLRFDPFVDPIEVHAMREQEIRSFCEILGDKTAYAWKGRYVDNQSPSTFKPLRKAIQELHRRVCSKGLASFMLDIVLGPPPTELLMRQWAAPAIYS